MKVLIEKSIKAWRYSLAALILAVLAGCSSHAPAPSGGASVADPIMVVSQLADQLHHWRGTPYHYGGMSKKGVDCSGFVQITFRDKFHRHLPRETRQQAELGRRINPRDLQPGDLVFFKTGSGENGLHVGIYDGNSLFIHASTSQGVTRSSLNNAYWKKHFWQARRP